MPFAGLPLLKDTTPPAPVRRPVAQTPIPFVLDWTFANAEQSHNGLRSQIILNGAWRWQPAGAHDTSPPGPPPDAEQARAADWLYLHTPGIPETGNEQAFYLRTRDGKRALVWKGKPIEPSTLAWIERPFTIPADWQDRRIWITLEGTEGGAEVFIDGQSYGFTWADIPADISLPSATAGSHHILSIKTRAVTRDVWLRSAPRTGPLIAEAWGSASWRQRQLAIHLEGQTQLPANAHLRTTLSRDADGREVVARLVSTPADITTHAVVDALTPAWQATLTTPWKTEDIHPWSIATPQLYWMSTEVLTADGAVIDRTLPERVGFREFWIEGGDFFLNGIPFYFYGNNITNFVTEAKRIGNFDPAIVRHVFGEWKKVGLNSATFWRTITPFETAYDVADELGLGIVCFIPSGNDLSDYGAIPQIKDYIGQRLAATIRRLRRHPSLFMYDFEPGARGYVWDYNPGKLADNFDPLQATYWPDLAERERSLTNAKADLARLDNTRPWFHKHAGNLGPVHGTMGYLGFDMDLAEREDWPLAWSHVRHKPLMNSEVGMPFEGSWYARRTRSSFPNRSSWPFTLEYAAMYFGEAPWHEAPAWQLRHTVDQPSPFRDSLARVELEGLFTTETMRAWRAYGISVFLHGPVRMWFEPEPPPRTLNALRSGTLADRIALEENTGPLNSGGKIAEKVLRPILMWIGGPESHFTTRDHAWFSGDPVEKSAIVVNDSEVALQVKGEWRLREKGQENILLKGALSAEVAAGKRGFLPIRFDAPPIAGRAECVLEVDLHSSPSPDASGEGAPGQIFQDTFAMQFFPRAQPVPLALVSQVHLLDPAGETAVLLRPLGVDARPISLSGPFPSDGLLIIGRKALNDPATSHALARAGIDRAIDAGLRVIVFEQAVGNLWGLDLSEETRPRQVFLTAAGHPVFEGILPEDLRNWRGASDLVDPYPDSGPPPPVRNQYPQRLWKWGTDNAVSTRVFTRPQKGTARALVCSGFDLMESPLLEVVRNRGRLLFCQMDLTNRQGVDPTATRLFSNILRYMDAVPAPQPMSKPVIVNPLEHLPEGWQLVRAERNLFPTPATDDARDNWGIVVSDFYYRPNLVLPCLRSSDVGKPVPVLITTAPGGQKTVVTAVTMAQFQTGWQKVKWMRALAALRMNCGESDNVGPRATLQDNKTSLYPIPWLEGFVHPYTHHRW